jgi:outer membrane receptor for ferrienterochelin and colicins
MKHLLLAFSLFFIAQYSHAQQNSLKIIITDAANKEPLTGVAVVNPNTKKGDATDIDGKVTLKNISDGTQTFILSFIGYQNDTLTQLFPLADPEKWLAIQLKPEQSDLEEVVVTSMRTNARIEDLPTKVEVLGAEELGEENTIKPASISSLLGDLSVIHIQQTSAISGGSVIRMQGLDGKYTQLLRDGLPLYDGFSGGLGILQIPPLDLRQVEIIKGSVSTLYGGGAIGGMINLVTKQPSDKPEWIATLNQSTLQETNANTYFAKKMGAWGFTFFGATTRQQAVDVNNDGFSDVPRVRNLIFHPRVFWYGEKSKFDIGYSGTFEQRDGGDIQALSGAVGDTLHSFFEKNRTQRNTFDGHFSHNFSKNVSIAAKTAVSLLNREVNTSNEPLFVGNFTTSFSEVSLLNIAEKHTMVGGLNLVTQAFDPIKNPLNITTFHHTTYGIFGQETWKPVNYWAFEGGFRADFHNQFGQFYLPRLSILYKPSQDWSARIGVGKGYRTPDAFTDNARKNAPLDTKAVAETSTGYNVDANWHHLFDELSVTVNQALYYVKINQPIINTGKAITNANGSLQTIGTDTYIRFSYDEIELYLGYNHTLARRYEGAVAAGWLSYSPQDKFAGTLAYEIEGKWRIGIENSWIANQYLGDGATKPRNYWFWAAMIERKFKNCSLVLNGENLADFRQSSFEPLFTGSRARPVFSNLWSPIDGRVINLSLKWNILK